MKTRKHVITTLIISFIMILSFSVNVNAATPTPEDGLYKVKCIVPENENMFGVNKSDNGEGYLRVKNGSMSCTIRLKGTGYKKLFIGTTQDAATAEKNGDPSIILPIRTDVISVTDEEGFESEKKIYVFEVPVKSLGTEIQIAARGSKWYDKTMTFAESRALTSEEVISLFEKTSKLSYDLTDAEYDKQELQTSIDALQQKYNETEAARAAAVTAKSNAESKVSNLNTTVNNLNAKIAVMGTKVGGVKAKAYRSSHKITVNWSKNSKVTGYKVYRATSLNGSYKAVKTTTSNTATIKNHKKGKTYYYKVIGYKNVAGSNVYTKDSAICVVKAK